MTNLKEKLAEQFLQPQSKFTRNIDTAFIFIAAFINAFVFYFINFDLCADTDCKNLPIMHTWYEFSYFYLLLAAADIGIGLYFIKEKHMEKIYALSLTTYVAISHIMIWLAVFGIAAEVKKAL